MCSLQPFKHYQPRVHVFIGTVENWEKKKEGRYKYKHDQYIGYGVKAQGRR